MSLRGLVAGLLTAALCACAGTGPRAEPTAAPGAAPPADSEAIQRGVEERPPPGAHLTPTAGPPQAQPTPTPSPTQAPRAAGLSVDPPWLLANGEDGIVAMNVDGSAASVLAGPPLWDPQRDIVEGEGLSRSGWVAARTGLRNDWTSADSVVPAGALPPAEVGIALWQLPETKPARVIPRLSDELLAGMGEVREFESPYGFRVTGPRWKHDVAFLSVLHPDARLFWSPNGRYLAFAAALDGPSSDVYAYDTRTDEIRRLTDGPNQAVLLGWSPDSQWVIHYEATVHNTSHGEIVGFRADVLWAAAVDGSGARSLGDADSMVPEISGWLSQTEVLLTVWTGGSSLPFELWSIDLDSAARQLRRDLSFYSAAAEPSSGAIAVAADARIDPEGGYLEGGMLVLPGLDGEPRWVGGDERIGCYGCAIEWVERRGAFLAFQPFNFGNTLRPPFLLLPNGEVLIEYAGEVTRPYPSPDGSWVAFASNGLRIYDTGGLRASVPGGPGGHLTWAGDSSGVYFLDGEPGNQTLRFVRVPDGAETLLGEGLALEGPHLVPVPPG